IAFPSNAYDAGFASQTFKRGSFARCSVFKEQSLLLRAAHVPAATLIIYHRYLEYCKYFFKIFNTTLFECVLYFSFTHYLQMQ
ncbi:hypothetical protein M6D81_19940, partial [Paenibacillus sp. J5C_2022]|uniref:hypothetical protein n=1 Tax=Paenibacillus sp. J5C2022 TaxID=2977129 RepID=UPI0021CE090B